MGVRRWGALGLAGFMVIASAAAWAQLGGDSSDTDKGVLAGLISRALSTPATRVSIGAVDGALSSDATIRNIEISDRDGVWLRLDRTRIVWRRLALVQRRLEIDQLEIGTIEVSRRPVPAEAQVAGEGEPLLPDLPVKVDVKAFSLAALNLGEPLLGTTARIGATGNARLSNDTQEGLDLNFNARRLDQPGSFAVKLGLVPQGQRLTLTLAFDEPADGLVARAASLPGLPPVKLNVGGDGTLDSFSAKLIFDAGPGIGATGSAGLRRRGSARELDIDLQAQIEGLIPGIVAPIFAGTTRLTGRVGFADDGAVSLTGIDLVAAAARLGLKGRIGPDGVADIALSAENLPNAGGATQSGSAQIARLAVDARLSGPLAGPTLDATIKAEDARLPSGRIGSFDASFKAAPKGRTTSGVTQLALTGDARATRVAPTDPAIARAIGDSLALTLRGTASTSGTARIDTLALTTPTSTIGYSGLLGSDEINGRLTLRTPNLTAFGGLAGLTLKGAAQLAADLEGTPRANRYNAKFDGAVTELDTGIPAIGGLFGRRLGLKGLVRIEPTGGYGLEGLELTGDNATARLNGRLAPEASDLTVSANVQDLTRVDARLTGRAEAAGRITGTLSRPDATMRVALTNGSALGRPIPRIALDIVGRDLLGDAEARVTLDGEVDRRPARGTLNLMRRVGGALKLDGLDLIVGSAKAKGNLALDDRGLATGRLAVDAPNLDDVSPLLLTKATGSISADLQFDSLGGGQDAKVKATADRIGAFGFSLDKAEADLRLVDLYRRPLIDGRIWIDEASGAGERISRIRLDAQGTPQASNMTLSATARGFDLDAKARVVPGDRTRVELAQLNAKRGSQQLALAGPATITRTPDGFDLRGIAVAFGAGRLTIDGLAGSRLDLEVNAKAVPLSAADIVAPGLGLAGTLDASARVTGSPSAPNGEYRAAIGGLMAPQIKSLGLPRIDVKASGRLENGRSTLDATVVAGRAGTIRIGGSVPVGGSGAIDLTVKGELDAAAASNGVLAAGGQRLTGRVNLDVRVAGTIAAPEANGSATLSGGTFTDAGQGVRLSNVRARLIARGQDLTIESASAATGMGTGSLTANGRVRLDPAGGFPGEIKLQGRNADLVRSPVVTLTANLDIALSGPLARDPRVSGRVDLLNADVAVPERLGAGLRPLPNTPNKNPTRTTRARLAAESASNGKRGRGAPAFDASLDIVLNAPGNITVRGRSVNAELGGNLRLTGRLAKPVANGAFELRRGTFQLATTKLDFNRGRLTFNGDLTPELDFLATTNAGGASIQIAVSGPSNNPNFAFTSSPDLPQDEVLSRLLFNSASGQLSPFQALALAQAAGQFSGGEGSDAFEALRRSLGLSGLDVGLNSGGVGLGLQQALGNRLSVGVKAGSSAAQTGLGVDLKVTDEIRLQGEVGATGGSSLGIGAQYEW